MEHEFETPWALLAKHREERINGIAARLKIESASEELHELLGRVTKTLTRELRSQFGSVLVERMEATELDAILEHLALSVGQIVNSVRGGESDKGSLKSTRDLLVGITLGSLNTAHNLGSLAETASGEGAR
jgi:hypothetical protein